MPSNARNKPVRLAAKLTQIRREILKVSQNELIRLLGYEGTLQREAVSSWERDRREPDLTYLLRLTRVANVTLESLIDDEMELEITERSK